METKAAPELGSHVSRRQRQDDEDRTAHDAHRFLTLTSEGAGLSRSRITDISQVQSRQTWRQITHRHGTAVCRPRCVVRIQSNRQCLSTWNQGGELTKAGGAAGLVRSDQVSECGLRFRTNDLHGAGGRSISDQTTQEAALGGMGIWDPRTEARGEDEWKLGAATRERCRTCAGAALGSAQEAVLFFLDEQLISHDLLSNKQYFSLTLNRSTVLVMAYKPNQPKRTGRKLPPMKALEATASARPLVLSDTASAP